MLTTLKKPLNVLDVPVYADIRAPAPRFVDSGKHWTVDVGRTQGQVEFMPEYQEHAVLAQQRDYNERIYGKKSSKDVVNKSFRPPLITLEDTIALTRIPRGFVVPRTNPGTTAGGFQLYPRETSNTTEFTSAVDKQHYTTEKVKHGYTFPTYYRPLNIHENIGGVVPDLQLKLKVPLTSVATIKSAPKSSHTTLTDQTERYTTSTAKMMSEEKKLNASAHTFVSSSFGTGVSEESPFDNGALRGDDEIREYTSLSAPGSFRVDTIQQEGNLELEENRPQYSAYASRGADIDAIKTTPVYQFEEKLSVKNSSAPISIKVDTINRSGWADQKMEKDIPRTRLETSKNLRYRSENNYRKPEFRPPSAKERKPQSYQTKGYVPKSGLAMGNTGRGLSISKSYVPKGKKN